MNKMCEYSKVYGYQPEDSWINVAPKIVASKRVKCPKCGRKMMSAVRYCPDGCCAYHCIPPHKVKGWWKKKKK